MTAAALKYILIPEQNYHALMNSSPKATVQKQEGHGLTADDLDEKAALEFVKKNLARAQKGKRRNVSAKNVLFNQRLRSYLLARNKLLNKPLKVQLEALGNKLLTKPNSSDVGMMNEEGEVEPVEKYEKVEEPDELYESFKSAGTSTSTEKASPSSSRKAKKKLKADEEKLQLSTKMSKLVQLVSSDPSKFGLVKGEKGKFQIENPRTNKPVTDSDLFSVITHLTDPRSTGNSPPGTRFFKNKLLADESARNLVDPKYLQIGKGCPRGIKSKIPKICKKILMGKNRQGKIISFRPMKWNIQKRKR